MRKYALSFAAAEFTNFREAEFYALLELTGLNVDRSKIYSSDKSEIWKCPFVVVELKDDDEAIRLIERSVLIKAVYHIWCEATTISELLSEVPKISFEFLRGYLTVPRTYKVVVRSANKKLRHDVKLDLIEEVLKAHTVLECVVSLGNPQFQLNVLLDYEPTRYGTGCSADGGRLRRAYYGRMVEISQRKTLMNEFRLSDRNYLGNTTLDVRLAGLMANIGLCQPGNLVWDPFLGTGSTVLAASVWGSFGGGSDIDYALLHGKGMSPKAGQGKRTDEECLRSSYEQYSLQSRFLDVMVADASTLQNLFRIRGNLDNIASSEGLFDAILTDPPYGFRERSRRVASQAIERPPSLITVTVPLKTESNGEMGTGTSEEENSTTGSGDNGTLKGLQTITKTVVHDLMHIPHKENYPLDQTYQDLMDLSVYLLRPGGRVLFWIPIKRPFKPNKNNIPRHPRLRLIAACEQVFNFRTGRFLIAMSKLAPDEPDEVSWKPNVIYPVDLWLERPISL